MSFTRYPTADDMGCCSSASSIRQLLIESEIIDFLGGAVRGRKNVTVSQKTPGLSWPWDGSAVARKSAVLIRRDVGFFFFW